MVGNVEHMVIPVIAIREGVLNGVFYPEAAISNLAEQWNGVPVPVSHPKDASGNFVTANSADAESNHNIGNFFNAKFETKTKALKGELWINIEKATLLGHKELLDRLDKGENVDVSTGLWTNAEPAEGNYRGKPYSSISNSFAADHLAILPNEKGACSVADGCGTFLLNHQGEDKPCCGSCSENKNKTPSSMFGNAFKIISNALGFINNETSHNEIHHQLTQQLRSSFKDTNKWQYIIDVFPDFFVYEQDESLFRQNYTLGKDDSVSIDGEPVLVTIKKHYEEILPKISTNQEQTNTMKPPHIIALASLLAANSITEAQHKSMQDLPDDILDGLIKANSEHADNVTEFAKPVEAIMANEDVQLLKELRTEREQRTIALRTHLKANCKQIPDTVVDTMNIHQLEETARAIPSSAAQITNFGLASGATDLVANELEKAYVAPSILLAPAKTA